MDEKDRLLLTVLEDNCHIPTQDLADMLDLDEDEIRNRIAKMEEEGIIKKYTAIVDWGRTGDGLVSALLELKVVPERDYGYDRIAERLARFSQVRSLRLISGVYDLELLVVAKNIHEITRFVADHIAPIEQVRETATILIMKTYKENGHVFFERKEGERLPFSF